MNWSKIIVFSVCVLLCSGCGVQDRALVLPVDTNGQIEVLQDETVMDTGTEELQGLKEIQGLEEINDMPAEGAGTISVYVCGAVQSPGVVEIPAGSRVCDALSAAGGYTEDAREDVLNLAAEVSDGQMLRFPSKAEKLDITTVIGPTAFGDSLQYGDGKVNINIADVGQLTTLSGIGESRAKDIVTYRESHGDFKKIEDIMKVSGIKESVFNKIKESITVD